MLAPRRAGAIETALSSCSVANLPSFLVPAFHLPRRTFSSSPCRPSKLGRTPISIPPGVELLISEPKVKHDATTWRQIAKRTVTIKGPLGQLDLDIPPFVHLTHSPEARNLTLTIEDSSLKQQKEMWGTTWAYLNRHITGVSEGHTAVLRLVGIGFRASVDRRTHKEEYPGQRFVILKLGYTHPIEMGVPLGVTATSPQPTRILLEGANREDVMTFAAKIRKWRVPEPYKGKGIFVNDETIKLKQKKIK